MDYVNEEKYTLQNSNPPFSGTQQEELSWRDCQDPFESEMASWLKNPLPPDQSPEREPAVDRKRKGQMPDESEDINDEARKGSKQVRPTKRTRAEIHNLSERRRRDRINKKMRALQELLPGCNKFDKVSVLDEAMKYIKSLQLQVKMMSMRNSIVPMTFSRMQQQQCMPSMGMGVGMSMGMEIGVNRPLMPFSNMVASSPLPVATPHLGPSFGMPSFPIPYLPIAPESSSMQAINQQDHMFNSLGGLPPSISTRHPKPKHQ